MILPSTMDEKFDEVCCTIRACLNSTKKQLSLSELCHDYKLVVGEAVPYQSLGYRSLEALLRAVPNLKISGSGNDIFVDVRPDEKTIHIANLVRGQKASKKKSKKKSTYGRIYRSAPAPPRRPFNDVSQRRKPSPPLGRNASNGNYYTRSNSNDHYISRSNNNDHYTSRTNDNYKSRTNSNDNFKSRTNNDYYTSRPSNNDHYASRTNTSYHSAPRRDPPHQYQKKPATPPISISSDDDFSEEKIRSRYQSSKPSAYNFSDPSEEGSDYDDFLEINNLNNEMNGLKVTLGSERQVSINKQKFRGYQSTTSNDDDYEYSSMNEINTATHESSHGDATHEKGDMSTKRSMARGPASFLAAGRAMQEPNIAHVTAQESRSIQHSVRNDSFTGDIAERGLPFKKRNIPLVSPTKTIPPLMSVKAMYPNSSSNKNKSPPPMSANTKSPPSRSANTKSPSSVPTNKGLIGSKMSDPNMFKPGPNVQPNLSEDTFCGKLYAFTVRHNLQPPVFKTFTKFCPKTKVASYMCKVKIGSSLSFTSCPYESQLVKEVHEYTAKAAFDELQRRYENLDSQALPLTTDENEIIKRVADIVNPHSNGLKCETIETKYKILHQQILPLDWIDIIKNRSLLSVEELLGGIIAVYPIEGINVHSDISKLPPLVLPENEVWNVYVTCCVSTSCLYFRIVHDDYNGRYATMDETMSDLYNLKKDELKHVANVKEGSYYAAYLDKSWFRVKALSTIIDDCVRVSLIDHGDVDEVEKENLYPLDERFTNVPPQKVSCSLTGLEEYSKEPYVTKIVYDLTCGRVFVAKVDSRNPHLQLTLLDTSTEVDVNVNELVLDRIDKELSPPKIPAKNGVTDACLVSVKEDGLAFVQILSESFKLLKSFLAEASQELAVDQEKYCVKYTSELAGNKIFLARYAADGQWYRALVVQVISEEEIEVLFVDYGNLDFVKMSDIADVKHFTEALEVMPHQAIQVRLVKPNDELFTENVLQFLMDLSLPKEDGDPTRYLLKTIKEGVVPDVELFLRLPDTNALVNLNDIIASYFIEYRGPNHVSVKLSCVKSNLIKQRKKLDRRMFQSKDIMERVCPIPIFDVPVGEQFSVFVTMVSSPFNFIVQPHDYRSKLANLMTEMNKFYETEQPLVDISNMQEEEAYAVKTDSGKWYRGVVVKVLSGLDCISMKLIDYGDIVSIKFSNLAHLLPCFRELPRQAIKAELAGIAPLHRDWSVEDSLYFKNLVSQKVLISVVVDVHKDGKISIILYDTSTDKEVDIGAVLVEEGRAKDITK